MYRIFNEGVKPNCYSRHFLLVTSSATSHLSYDLIQAGHTREESALCDTYTQRDTD